MQGLFCLLQDDLAVFIGIHHKGAAGCQRAVDQALGGTLVVDADENGEVVLK